MLVTAIQAKGSVLVHQKMFESRLFFVDKLIDMGAQIILLRPHRAVVIGLEREQQLRGITMSSPIYVPVWRYVDRRPERTGQERYPEH